MIELAIGIACIFVLLIVYKKKKAVVRNSGQTVEFTRDLKMVMVVRTDLKMGHGKVAAQCCHACLGLYKMLLNKDVPRLQAWERSNYKKVVVKCGSQEDMLLIAERAKAKGLEFYIVRDAGLTQIAPGSKTVLSIGPAMEEELVDITNHLKLL